MAKKVLDSVAPIAVRPSMKNNAEQLSRLRMKLACAGLRSEGAPTTFLASKTVVAVLLGIAAVAYVWAKGVAVPNAVGIVSTAIGLGFLAPNLWLSSAVSKRKRGGGS